jgi:HAD superfamily hydrolase (TIGR01509 family)
VRFEEIIGENRLNSVMPEQIAAAMEASAAIFLDESLPITDEELEFAARRNYFLDLAKRLSWTLTDREADVLARDMTENDARYDFYDEARWSIMQLRDMYPLGMLSDAMPSARRVYENAGLLELFDEVVFSCDVAAVKPSEKMYAAICEKLEADPKDCIFCDDRICNIEGAEKFGMTGVHMCREGESEWHGDVVRDLAELVRLVREK